MFQLILLCINFLLCSIKSCRVLEKIVVFCRIVFCSRKDCCVLEKIVVFSERLLCSAKDCCVLKKIIVFLNWNCVVFCPYGPPYATDERPHFLTIGYC